MSGPQLSERLKRLIEKNPLPVNNSAKPKKAPKRKKNDYEFDPTRVNECSDSELVEIAHRLGYERASRGMCRDDLIDVILYGTPIEEGADVLADVREKLHAFVEGNRSTISAALMRCDLNCPACPHQQMVACFATNRDLLAE